MRNTVLLITIVFLFSSMILLTYVIDTTNRRVDKLESNTKVDKWHLQSYHYVITLQDEDWIEVRHADGSIVGQVKVDTLSPLGQLFIKDNE